jgi:hypothetical protein
VARKAKISRRRKAARKAGGETRSSGARLGSPLKSRGQIKQRNPLAEIPAALNHARLFWMQGLPIKTGARNVGVSEGRLRRLIHKYKLGKWDRKQRSWRVTDRLSSLLKNLEIGALPVFLPWGFGAVGML